MSSDCGHLLVHGVIVGAIILGAGMIHSEALELTATHPFA
jgi:hypothetical protein